MGLFWWRIWCRGATTTPYHSCQTSGTMMQWGLVVDVEAAHSSVFHPPAPPGDHIHQDKLWAAEDLSWSACWVLAELTTSKSLKKEMIMVGRGKTLIPSPFFYVHSLPYTSSRTVWNRYTWYSVWTLLCSLMNLRCENLSILDVRCVRSLETPLLLFGFEMAEYTDISRGLHCMDSIGVISRKKRDTLVKYFFSRKDESTARGKMYSRNGVWGRLSEIIEHHNQIPT